MISIWVFVLACVVFLGILGWERYSYLKLRECYKCVTHYLDMYIAKNGQVSFEICDKVLEDIIDEAIKDIAEEKDKDIT